MTLPFWLVKLHAGQQRFCTAAWVWCLLAMFCATSVNGREYYVSPGGSDRGDGAKDRPYATLQYARDNVRIWRQLSGSSRLPVTIWLAGGRYELTEPLVLQKEDSGFPDAPVVYRALPGQTPVLSGACTIRGFRPWKGNILCADISKTRLAGVQLRELFCNGRRLTLARYPNSDPEHPVTGGWAYAEGAYQPLYEDIPGESQRELIWKPQDSRPWSDPLAAAGAEVFVYPRFNWWNNIIPVAAVDLARRKATLAKDASYAIRPGDRYFVQNLLSELDAPGEWYLDPDGTLYVYPPAGVGAEALQVQAPVLPGIVRLEAGTAHVTLRGLTLENSVETAILCKDAIRCHIAACTIRNAGNYNGNGIHLDGGQENGAVGNDISGIGRHGILLSGGDPVALRQAGNFADNNYIHHTGVYYKEGCGIQMYGCGNRASHNDIHDCPRFAIRFDGNRMVVEYNHVRHLSLETCDTGGIYTGCRNWINARGSVIRYNYIHDVIGFGFERGKWRAPNFGWGIYLDDNSAGVTVTGNLVVRAPSGLLHLHSARDCRIENNVFVQGGERAIQYSGWRADSDIWTRTLQQMREGYAKIKDLPQWKDMPGPAYAPDTAPLPDGTVMSGDLFERNIVTGNGTSERLLLLRNVNLARNRFDHNLYWNAGRPVDNGAERIGPAGGENLVPWVLAAAPNNAGDDRLPPDWQWQVRPRPDARAGVILLPDGPALRMNAAFAEEKPKDNAPIVVSREIALHPGKAYRLTAKMRGVGTAGPARLSVQSYQAGGWFWGSWPSEVTLTPEWQAVEVALVLPGPGDRHYHEGMGMYRARIDFLAKTGELQVRDLTLRQAEQLDPWVAWQRAGNDSHSLVADPLFADPARDDYRLRPESPAFGLGFQALPLEKIGLYADELRASWPVVEAPGAREHPDLTAP